MDKSQAPANVNARETKIEAVVIRCGCGDPTSHTDSPCPHGVPVNLGTISYWHKSPLKRWAYALSQRFHALTSQKER